MQKADKQRLVKGKNTKKKNLKSAAPQQNKTGLKEKRQRTVKKSATLIIKQTQGEKWFTLEVERLAIIEDVKHISKEELGSIRKRAENLLEKDNKAYMTYCTEGDGRSDYLWMNKILKTGTLPDKMAAYTVRIQDSPVHGLYSLQQLIGMVKPQGKQQCLMVSDTLRDLFLQDLLPPNQKLRTFESRSLSLQSATEKQLILWLFEDRLKNQYFNFIEAVRRMSSDQIEKLRGKGISIMEQLLSSHPEREDLILQILVNKLGDPVKKVGSRALFHLNKVLEKHPQMKLIVVSEVERLLFRNNVSNRAKYYGICFMNALRLEISETSLAAKLVKVYLAFFKACVKTGEINSKMMGGLLTGVNRSFPIAKLVGFEFTESLDVLFKIVQLSQFNIGVQALALLSQITGNNPSTSDRFYRVLYRKLLDSEVATTSHGVQFLNIVFKAMKNDTVVNRVKGFSKRLLQVCGSSPPNMVCAMLFLISEVGKTHQTVLSLDKIEQKDMKVPPITIATKEIEKENEETESRNGRLTKISKHKKFDMEHLAKTTNLQFEVENPIIVNNVNIDSENLVEITDDLNQSVNEIKVETDKRFQNKEYDPLARNPSFCGAEKTLAFELIPLTYHFHPSVALFAKTLLNRASITYDGNPLKDFTVGRFLERFVYRNAKANKTRHQDYQPQGLRAVPVNSSSYLQNDEYKIPVEEKFFYKFFKEAKDKFPGKSIKEEEENLNSDAESVGDEEFDDIMGNYFKSNGAVMSDEEDVDFMSDVQKAKTKKGKAKNVDDEVDESDLSDEEDDLNEDGSFSEGNGSVDDDVDELIEMDSEDEVNELDSEDEPEFDAEDGEIDDDEDDGMGIGENLYEDDSDDGDSEFSELKSRLKIQGTRNKLKGLKGNGLFAPAEQFSEMLESNAKVGLSGSHTLINTDNSDAKQLKWEDNRDRWVKGYKRNQKVTFKNNSKKRKFK